MGGREAALSFHSRLIEKAREKRSGQIPHEGKKKDKIFFGDLVILGKFLQF